MIMKQNVYPSSNETVANDRSIIHVFTKEKGHSQKIILSPFTTCNIRS